MNNVVQSNLVLIFCNEMITQASLHWFLCTLNVISQRRPCNLLYIKHVQRFIRKDFKSSKQIFLPNWSLISLIDWGFFVFIALLSTYIWKSMFIVLNKDNVYLYEYKYIYIIWYILYVYMYKYSWITKMRYLLYTVGIYFI